MTFLWATSVMEATNRVVEFLINGGPFMAAIVLCSIVALAVTVMKLMTLRKVRIIPDELASDVERFDEYLENDNLSELEKEFRSGNNVLSRLCTVAIRNAGRSQIFLPKITKLQPPGKLSSASLRPPSINLKPS